MTSPKPVIDVVVLTMNDRPAAFPQAMASLLAQRDVELRVIIVGNGVEPDPDQVPAGVRTVTLPVNAGIPAGRNVGADVLAGPGCGEFVFFFDNDAVLPAPDTLARLVAEARRHRPRPARRLLPSRRPQPGLARLPPPACPLGPRLPGDLDAAQHRPDPIPGEPRRLGRRSTRRSQGRTWCAPADVLDHRAPADTRRPSPYRLSVSARGPGAVRTSPNSRIQSLGKSDKSPYCRHCSSRGSGWSPST